jgi:hypothetical protein
VLSLVARSDDDRSPSVIGLEKARKVPDVSSRKVPPKPSVVLASTKPMVSALATGEN